MDRAQQRPLRSLTGLRAPAAYVVFLYHMTWVVPGLRAAGDTLAADVVERVALRGYVGVSFFFVLSGFVLAWSHRPGERPRRFWWKRAVRVYPNHIVTWLVALGFIVTGIATAPPIGGALANLALLPHVLVPGADWTVMNNPSWSIEVEAFFYLLFPLLLPRLVGLADGALTRAVVIAGAITLAMPLLAQLAGLGEDEGVWRLLYFFPLTRLPEFVVGVGLGLLARRGRVPAVDRRVAWAAVALGVAVSSVAPIPFTFAAITLVPFVLLIAAYAGADRADTPTRLAGRHWVHLGATSYAFYAVHDLVIRLVVWRTDGGAIGWATVVALTAGCFVASLAAAELLHRTVEVPAMRRLRSKPVAVPATPA